MSQFLDKFAIRIILILYAPLVVISLIYFNGTGDDGDSITHYLFAKYAPIHPILYFNHWAKPLFVLLASPFAQFGFTGIKIFNASCVFLTLFTTYKTAKKLHFKNPSLAPLLLLFAPLYYSLTFSGLTEPLFALFLIGGLYFAVCSNYFRCSIIISFLPFIRSEGLIILLVFGFFFLLKKQWKFVALLLSGHIIYSLAGFFVHGDLLWVFTKIPYASLSSPYGSGDIFHFAEQLIYITGVPFYILFWIGTLNLIVKTIQGKIRQEETILIVASCFTFIIAHSLFWYLGIFNSMGLKRVLICVIPLVALISLSGFNFLTEEILFRKNFLKYSFQILLILYILIFPFTRNKAALNWEKDLTLNTPQKMAIRTFEFVEKNYKTRGNILYAYPYLSEIMHIDPFDKNADHSLSVENLDSSKTGDIIIWENWFSVIENGITEDYLKSRSNLQNVFYAKEKAEREFKYEVFQVK